MYEVRWEGGVIPFKDAMWAWGESSYLSLMYDTRCEVWRDGQFQVAHVRGRSVVPEDVSS